MESQFGIEVPHYEGMGGRVFKFEDHFLQAHIDDVLEKLSTSDRTLPRGRTGAVLRIRSLGHTVRQVFAEEHMAYRIDDDGVVHPLVVPAMGCAFWEREASMMAASCT